MLNNKKMFTKILSLILTPTTTTYSTTSLSHLASASVSLTRIGNIGLLYIAAKNTASNLAVGSEASFKITDFPNIATATRGVGYSGSTCMVVGMTASNQGAVTMRVLGAQWVSSYDVAVVVPVIFT